jgi:hypothetical protein
MELLLQVFYYFFSIACFLYGYEIKGEGDKAKGAQLEASKAMKRNNFRCSFSFIGNTPQRYQCLATTADMPHFKSEDDEAAAIQSSMFS